MGIEPVINKENSRKSSDGLHDGMCSACEMTVVWIQNQLKQNMTKDRIISYVNEVGGRKIKVRQIIIISLFNDYLLSLGIWQLCNRLPSPMGQSSVDCDHITSMPPVSFTIGGKNFELSPEEVQTILQTYYWCSDILSTITNTQLQP